MWRLAAALVGLLALPAPAPSAGAPTSPPGTELVIIQSLPNRFRLASQGTCCKVWLLVNSGDSVSRLNQRYGTGLFADNARLQAGSWQLIDFSKLTSRLQQAISSQWAHRAPAARSPAAAQQPAGQQPAAPQAAARATPAGSPSGPSGIAVSSPGPSRGAKDRSGGHASRQRQPPGGVLPDLQTLLAAVALLAAAFLLGHFVGERRRLAKRLDDIAARLAAKDSTTGAAERLQVASATLASLEGNRERVARALDGATRLGVATDPLLMAQQIALVVASASEQEARPSMAAPWTIFTWKERWSALLEERRSGELVTAKEVLHRHFPGRELAEFIGQVEGVLSVMPPRPGDLAGPATEAASKLSRLVTIPALIRRALAAQSGLQPDAALQEHLQQIAAISHSVTELREALNRREAEAAAKEDRLRNLEDQLRTAQTELESAGFGGDDLFGSLETMKARTGDSRTSLAGWADWWRRLALALGFQVPERDAPNVPPTAAVPTNGAWWELRLGLVAMLDDWPAAVTRVPAEVRTHLRTDEAYRGALDLVGRLEEWGGSAAGDNEADRLWGLLKEKAVAINRVVRCHEFLRTYYAAGAPAFRHRLAMGVAALELAFEAARARLVKIDLLAPVSRLDPSLDVEYLDADLRNLEGPRIKIPARLAQARGGGFPVDIVACGFERDGSIAARGRIVLVTPGTWKDFLPQAQSDA
jgi:hypothetical protein